MDKEPNGAALKELRRAIGQNAVSRLFEEIGPVTRIELTSLRSAGLSGARLYRATVIDAHGNPEVPQVIKIGNKEQLRTEKANYEKFAFRVLKRTPNIFHHSETENVGLLAFEFAGQETLADRILHIIPRAGDSELEAEIKTVLNYFSSWHNETTEEEMIVAKKKYAFRGDYFTAFDQQVSTLRPPDQDYAIPPHELLKNTRNLWQRTTSTKSLTCTCHADLHPYNILYTEDNSLCAIDYYYTQPDHHFLRDFVILEVDSILKVLCPDNWNRKHDFDQFLDLKSCLFNLHDFFLEKTIAYGPNAKAAITIARTIRSHALGGDRMTLQYMSEYLIGLMRYLVSRTGQKESGLNDTRRLISAHFAIQLDKTLKIV